ncbi:hypothetical protein JQ604_12010 [Bradyrhizobium jicamae]|uniref:TnsA endonuclease N-terminal domain-containing protein n=1 Tax=Bradyrhizobium jicamae TaxID=280332 RepID=UPI001BA98704|nr:TnsA endonuclease N-terminal domain-containing protein [Bradyrhizobium jicamae]MBR0752911.1 hypothetical protein [Bradyrhizobium jicamae]
MTTTWKTLEDYLKPNPNLRPPVATSKVWTPPRRSRGKRKISLRSKGSSRGGFQANGNATAYESNLELDAALSLLARPDVVDVIDQYPQVSFVDADGKRHRFTFDFMSIHADGTKTAHSVKPESKVEASRIQEIHGYLQWQMSPKVATRINLITEEKLTDEDRFNARLIHTVRRKPYPDDDAIIERLISGLHGSTTLGALAKASGRRGYGYRAAARAVAAGKLRLVRHGRMVSKAVVCRPNDKT